MLEEEDRRLEEKREEQKAEVGMLEEETMWLIKKRTENVNLILGLDEQEDMIKKRKEVLRVNLTLYEEDVKDVEIKQKKLKEDEARLDEEAKWIESKREEHVQRAQELDDEKKWLDQKQKELEEFARLIGIETEDEASPESIEAFEEAKENIIHNNLAKFTEIINAHPEIVNFIESEGHNTLLHWSAAYNRLDIAEMLIESGATQFTNDIELTPHGITALAVDEGKDMNFYEINMVLKNNL